MLFLEYSKHFIIQNNINFLFQTFDGCVLSAVYDASSLVHHVDNWSLSEIIRRISEIIFIPIRSDPKSDPIRSDPKLSDPNGNPTKRAMIIIFLIIETSEFFWIFDKKIVSKKYFLASVENHLCN